MNTTYLLLGSNMGDSKQRLAEAKKYIAHCIGNLSRRSGLYQTAAWGKTDQPDFINQVLIVETTLSPVKTMEQILLIEESMGRVRTAKNAPRIIDIDILFFNAQCIKSPGLTIPHPLIQERKFVLTPLNELSPGLVHPLLNKTINRLLMECSDPLDVKKI